MAFQAPNFTIKRITPHLPEDDIEDTLARYRELRLDCLQKEAKWFSSRYSDEVDFTRAEWEARVLNPLATCYVIVIESGCTVADTTFPSGTWIGFLTAIGPFEFRGETEKLSPYLEAVTSFLSKLPKYADFSGAHYHAVSMYVKSEFRQLGLGAILIQSILNNIKSRLTHDDRLAVISLTVEQKNLAAQKVYAKAGFVHSELFDLGKLLEDTYKKRGMERQENEMMSFLMDIRIESSSSI